MRYEILTHFFGQHVEVTMLSRTYSGVIRQAEVDGGHNDVIELEPVGEYKQKRFGSTIMEVDLIKSIKPIKPYEEDMDGEMKMCEDDCCDDMGL